MVVKFFYKLDSFRKVGGEVLCTKRPKIKTFISSVKSYAVESDWLTLTIQIQIQAIFSGKSIITFSSKSIFAKNWNFNKNFFSSNWNLAGTKN